MVAILQNQQIIPQQLLHQQHKNEEIEKRLTDITGKSEWYKANNNIFIKLITFFIL